MARGVRPGRYREDRLSPARGRGVGRRRCRSWPKTAGRIVGTVRYWPIDDRRRGGVDAGADRDRRRPAGAGHRARADADEFGRRARGRHRAVVLVGDEPYYGRAGFKRIEPAGRITMPGPVDLARLLGLALVEGALDAMKGEISKA